MLLLRALALFLILITNTWLLNPVHSDSLSRHKRAMARRADRELSRLTGEPCTVRSRRQPRSLSASQQQPPAARPRTHTTRGEPLSLTSAPAVCAGGCSFGTGVHRVAHPAEVKGGRGEPEEVSPGYDVPPGGLYDTDSSNDRLDSKYVNKYTANQHTHTFYKDPGQSVSSAGHSQPPHRSLAKVPRSLGGTSGYEEESNSSWEEVFPDSQDAARKLQVLYRLQEQEVDLHSSAGTLEDDFSGEVEEVGPPVSLAAGSASPWGSPVPRVPSSWMTALYFSGSPEQLKVKPAAGVELPRGKFSLELWVKPEGGQSNPAVIVGG